MKFSLIGICLDRKQFRRGSDKAPYELRNAFLNIETFLDGIDLQEHWLKDLGNIIPKSYDDIEKQIKEKIDLKSFPIILGGDHSITFSAVKALRPKVFVSFDAHPDCIGNDLSPKSVTRKIFENGFKTMLYGIRTISKEESKFLSKNQIKILNYEELKQINEPTYLSIDFDVLDPSIMPCVAYPEPNGLTFNQVLDAIKALAKNLIAIDFVEFVPTENLTYSLIAGKLIYSSLAEVVKSLQ
ncbi:MAG: arginase family protein [Candidatus Aenigmatarchaeota archaeon]